MREPEKNPVIDYVGRRMRQTMPVESTLTPKMDIMLEQLRRSEASVNAALPKRAKSA